MVSIVVGMLWYSPILFGDLWLRLIGKRADEIGGAGPAMGLAALAAERKLSVDCVRRSGGHIRRVAIDVVRATSRAGQAAE